MKKASIEVGVMVTIIIAVVVIAVLAPFIGTAISFLRGGISESECVFSAGIMSWTKVIGKTSSDIDCPARNLTLEYKNLNKKIPTQLKEDYKEHWGEYYANLETKDSKELQQLQVQYFTYKAVAEEMKDCWNKLGRGKLNLFNQDFNALEDRQRLKIPSSVSASALIGGINVPVVGPWFAAAAGTVLAINTGLNTNSVACVICSRMTIDKEIQKTIFDLEVSHKDISFNTWLQKSPAFRSLLPENYYEFLRDEGGISESIPITYSLDIPNEPLAVVFIRVNPAYIIELSKKAFSKEKLEGDSGYDIIALVPYTQSSLSQNCEVLKN